MALFGKKKEQPQEPERTAKAAADVTDQENKKQSDSAICYNRLEAQFLMEYQGVVLKLYIENFKRMNAASGCWSRSLVIWSRRAAARYTATWAWSSS